MRVLHGPVNIGNQPWVLSRAERRLGLDSDVVVTTKTWLNYGADRVLSKPGGRNPADLARRVGFGLTAPFQYDVLHLYFGRSFLSIGDNGPARNLLSPLIEADVRVARRLGRKVVMTLQGCDVRIASRSNARNAWTMCAQGHCSSYGACLTTHDPQRRRMVERLLPLCDRVFYLNPELGHELPADAVFLPYASCNIADFDVLLPRVGGRPRIVHAPSDNGIKGTPLILEALERLRSRFAFDLVLIENTPHEQALALYRDADIAIDQVLAGWYGGYAVEMMAMGKPVVCAMRESDLDFVPAAMRADLPLRSVHPDSLADNLAAILSAQAQWPEWGRKSRRFVERWHDPDTIARAMAACYRDPESRFDLLSALTPPP